MVRSRANKATSSNSKEDGVGAVTTKDAPKHKARNSKTKAQKQQQPQQSSTNNRSKGKKGTPGAAAKGKSNKKSGTKSQPKKSLTAEELDKQMDDYMMRNEKTAEKVLEDQMDSYWAQKGKSTEDQDQDATAEDPPDV
jgi:hypothetical protein